MTIPERIRFLVVGRYMAAWPANSAGTGIPAFIGIASGISVAGYFAGREIDRRVTVIRIVE